MWWFKKDKHPKDYDGDCKVHFPYPCPPDIPENAYDDERYSQAGR